MNVNYRRVLLPVITLFNTNNFNINIVNVINRFHELREKTWLSHDALVLSRVIKTVQEYNPRYMYTFRHRN